MGDVVGSCNFSCKECGVRFKRHPLIQRQLSDGQLSEVIGKFRDGLLTFTDAMPELGVTLGDFNKQMQRLFKPQETVETTQITYMGKPTGPERVTSRSTVQRISCPKELEDLYKHDPTDRFAEKLSDYKDVSGVSYYGGHSRYEAGIYTAHFDDGSSQLFTPEIL